MEIQLTTITTAVVNCDLATGLNESSTSIARQTTPTQAPCPSRGLFVTQLPPVHQATATRTESKLFSALVNSRIFRVIVGMSGQFSNKLESRAFDSIMNLLTFLLDRDLRSTPKFNNALIQWYRNSGYPDWHELYPPDEARVGQAILDSVGTKLGIPQLVDTTDLEKLAAVIEQLLDLLRTGLDTDDPDLERIALMNGMQWLFYSKASRVGLWCELQYDMTVAELLEESKKGDPEVFLKLVKLDSTFLATKQGKRFLAEMELKNDLNLRQQLALALDPPPGFWRIKGGKRDIRSRLAISALNMIGFHDQPDSTWSDFLVAKGYKNFESEKAVAQARYRLGIKKPHSS